MSTFKSFLGLGGAKDDKSQSQTQSQSQSTSQQTTHAVSAEHSGQQSKAEQKASNLVPATVVERDDAEKTETTCKQESEVSSSCAVNVPKFS